MTTELRVAVGLRGGVEAAPLLGLGLGLGPARLGVEAGLPGGVVEDGTLQRVGAELGLGWGPAGVVAPEVGGGLGLALLVLRDPDIPAQAAATPLGFAELGLRVRPGRVWSARVSLRGGVDLRGATVQPVEGELVELGRAWLEPGLAVVAHLR